MRLQQLVRGALDALILASQTAAAPSATPTVPAELAHACLQSIPLNVSAALALLEAVKPYLEWQSTTAYLKDPPGEYTEKVQEGVDVWGGLEGIAEAVKRGEVRGEWEFGWSLYSLLQSTHDGHLVYVPDSVGGIFNFGRPLPLVSVSSDGFSLPQAYAYPDILAASLGNASFTPSHIVQIDGEDAAAWLEKWSQYGSLQDRDALYNNVFYELAIVALGTTSAGMGTFTGGGRGRWVYPGATTELTFANGSTHTTQNFAKVLTSFDGIRTGADIYRKYFTLPADVSFHNGEEQQSPTTTATATSSTSTSSASTTTSTPAPGYPSPVIRHENNLIGGYFLSGAEYADVAVLNVASFVGSDSAELSFKATSQQFLAQAKAAGKTKLIVDVSANGGGTILQGYDLFKQLFPQLDAFAAADRTRAFEALDLLGQKFSEVAGTVPRTLEVGENETLFELEADVVSSSLNYRTDLTPSGQPFSSWAEKYSPHTDTQHNDSFSSPFRWNLSDVLTPLNSGGIWVTGYGEEAGAANATAPFEPHNVLVMTDGYCASTCTIFSRLMRELAGVRHVAVGGRARQGAMQAVGGVKGTNDWGWSTIQSLVSLAYSLSTPAQQAHYNATSLARYNDQTPFLRAANNTSFNINFRDGIAIDDVAAQSPTPLQFVYEKADCRVFWTAAMTLDSAWGERSWCVDGGLGAGGGNATVGRGRAVAGVQSEGVERRAQTVPESARLQDYPLDLWTDVRAGVERGDGLMAI
ncbi:uncharacterized protein K452DRAFT_352962 [Aplosporella prunicola CBS 121167]|uniref:Uncharacterized protein n=1 Tax=Aplosporella prunicola CBS 121167 TaxID=1176127 RepID=A0A6A6B6L0_9PEZI|nr:uncharacterized protein K452DRAFT_352962 [Aplosporella prunicola CBS 121167]KAF2138885.1 hypothetical protein K452DRAFT_352962 [Aplosporella prunicola CBS 121167]